MKNCLFMLSMFAAFAIYAENPVVSDVTFSYAGGRQPALITYTLSGAPAIVTVDIETNTLSDATGAWVNIGGAATDEIKGAAATVVWTLGTTVKAYWTPGISWPNKTIAAGTIRARVTAFPTNSPPDYLVANLTGDTNVVRFYTCEASLPGGIGSERYRTTHLAMRRIPAANVVWRMGIPTGETGASVFNSPHKVLLTEDYYMGVFELTQGQYSNFAKNPSLFKNAENASFRPVERVTHTLLRGQNGTADDPYGWPREDHAVSSDSVIAKIRQQTGLSMLDLPTDAQWEYACRAGTGTPINSGIANPTATNWREVAWSSENSTNVTVGSSTKRDTHPVGSKRPNNWGLYDMHANILELCLDWRALNDDDYTATFQPGWEDGAVTTNPVGVAFSTVNASGPKVVKRGGSLAHAADPNARSGYHFDGGWKYEDSYIGCRLVCPLSDVVIKPLDLAD